MKEIELFPHNEEAYQKLISCLDSNQMVSINHATGTGKSFIILKYLAEHSKRKVLFLSPSYPINDQLVDAHMKELGMDKNQFEVFDTEIYSNLLGKNMEEIAAKYDLIILDEYHRCGAPEWGKAVNQLLDIIKRKYPNTRVIGTTATEIRYLDAEKNMNNILFDGVCASRLTLADAILRGILPVPVYFNLVSDLIEDLNKIEETVRKKNFYKRDYEEILTVIEEIRNSLDNIVNNNFNILEYLSGVGKYLVFSSTIDNIAKDKKMIQNIFRNEVIRERVVHSGFSKEANKREIAEFRNDTDCNSFLYSVNILNEGLHVKGIKAIFMMRPTTSPIIFFQQLGRLLSFSNKKDCVYVFDFVNNIKRSPYIYDLFQEVTSRAEELMETDLENKERYIEILDKFKIVDCTSKISEKLDLLKEKISIHNFNSQKLETAIQILEGKISSSEAEKIQAQLDLFKLVDYITIFQFDRIKYLNVAVPGILKLSREDFIELLNGHLNIITRDKLSIEKLEKLIRKFVSIFGHLPSIFSDEEEERELGLSLMKNKFRFTNDFEEFILTALNNQSTIFEQLFFRKHVSEFSEDIFEQLDTVFNYDIKIPISVINYLERFNSIKYNVYCNKIRVHNLKFQCSMEDRDLEPYDNDDKLFDVSDDIMLREYFSTVLKESLEEMENFPDSKEYITQLFVEIVDFIKTEHRSPNYYKDPILRSFSDNFDEKRLFCQKIIFKNQLQKYGYLEIIDTLVKEEKLVELDLKKKATLDSLINFIDEHQGDYPLSRSDKAEEQALARNFSKIKKYLTKEDIELLKKLEKKYDKRHEQVVQNYLNFIKSKKRFPLKNSNDELEKQLFDDYFHHEGFLTSEEKRLLQDVVNGVKKKNLNKNTYLEMRRIEEENKQKRLRK